MALLALNELTLFFNTDNCNAMHSDWKHAINKQNLEIVKNSTNRNYNFLCTREFHLLRQVLAISMETHC